MENLEQIEAASLNDDMYIVINQDVYPRSVKVKLGEFKKWLLQDFGRHLDEIDKKASICKRHVLIGPAKRR